jgi:hypothetical protein
MKLLKLTWFAALTFLAGGGCVQTSAQTVLGKHPADVVRPNFLGQNGNANTILNGLSAYGTVPLALPGGLTLGGVTMTQWPSVASPANVVTQGQAGLTLTTESDSQTFLQFIGTIPPYNSSVTNLLSLDLSDGSLVFSGAVQARNFVSSPGESLGGGFIGNGMGLTDLNGAEITPGTVNLQAFDTATVSQLVTNGEAGVWLPGLTLVPASQRTSSSVLAFSGSPDGVLEYGGNGLFYFNGTVSAPGFTGSGGGLTSLNGGAIQAGTLNSNALDAATAAQLALAGQAPALTMNDLAAIPGAGFSVVNWGYPVVPTLVWNGIYNSPAFASIQAPSPYELDIGGISGTSQMMKVVRNQSSAYIQFGGFSVSFSCEAPVYSASGFSGSGAGLTTLNGAAIQAGTVNSNSFDAATTAQLALAGQAPSHVPYTAITDAPWLTLASQGIFGPAINGNTVNGFGSLANLASGTANTAEGFEALSGMNSGNDNVAIGYEAMSGLWSGSANIAIGANTLALCSTASGNIAVGYLAGSSIRNNNNIDIGNTGQSSDAGVVRIGTPGTHVATYLAGCVFANGGGLTNIPVTAFAATNAPQPGYYLRVDKTGTNLYYSPN